VDGRWVFPRLEARDLDARTRSLPAAFEGDSNVVILAFRRRQQELVDTWTRSLADRFAADPGLRFYELPVIGAQWRPARRMIDGGMAAALPDTATRRRTLTVYTDTRRATDALAIADTSTITVLLVDGAGTIRWRTTGAYGPEAGDALAAAVERTRRDRGEPAGPCVNEQFDFAFDPAFRAPLAALGVLPDTAFVTVRPDAVIARFGPWSCVTEPDNIECVQRTGPYRWYRAIGPRGSFADRGATFGSSVRGGVCLQFRRPVHALAPTGLLRHPGLTVTVADPDRLVAALGRLPGVPG
jgi:hypothetical protein